MDWQTKIKAAAAAALAAAVLLVPQPVLADGMIEVSVQCVPLVQRTWLATALQPRLLLRR